MKHPLQVISIITTVGVVGFVIAIPFLLAADDHWFRAVTALLCAVSLLCNQLLLQYLLRRQWVTQKDAFKVYAIWIIMMLGNGFGSLGLYKAYFYYDISLHFIFPFLGAEFFYTIFNTIAQSRQHHKTHGVFQRGIVIAIVSSILLMMICGWEAYELIADAWIGTAMSFQLGDNWDTLSDILAGIAAIGAAAILERREWGQLFGKQ